MVPGGSCDVGMTVKYFFKGGGGGGGGGKKSSNLRVSDCCAIIVAQCFYVYLNNYPTIGRMKHSLSLLIWANNSVQINEQSIRCLLGYLGMSHTFLLLDSESNLYDQ